MVRIGGIGFDNYAYTDILVEVIEKTQKKATAKMGGLREERSKKGRGGRKVERKGHN